MKCYCSEKSKFNYTQRGLDKLGHVFKLDQSSRSGVMEIKENSKS